MSDEELSEAVYRIVLRRTVRGLVVQFRATGAKGREVTLVRLTGRGAELVYRTITESLARDGLATEEVRSTSYTSYRLAESVGAAVGGLLIIVRRSRQPTSWAAYFNDLVRGDRYSGSREVLASALRLAVELSRAYHPSGEASQINPRVLDAISAGLKVMARKLWGLRLS